MHIPTTTTTTTTTTRKRAEPPPRLAGCFLPHLDTHPTIAAIAIATATPTEACTHHRTRKNLLAQREAAADLCVSAAGELLQRPRRRPRTHDGRTLFCALRRVLARVLRRKTEAEWACCLHGPQKELMGALLLGVLKSVVVVAAMGRKSTLWSVGGRRAKLRKELRSEARRAREMVALRKRQQEQAVNENTYDSKRCRLGNVLPTAVCLQHLSTGPSYKTTADAMPPAPRPAFSIATVFKPETGSIPRASPGPGDCFSSVLPLVLRPQQKRYGASEREPWVARPKSKLRYVSSNIEPSTDGNFAGDSMNMYVKCCIRQQQWIDIMAQE